MCTHANEHLLQFALCGGGMLYVVVILCSVQCTIYYGVWCVWCVCVCGMCVCMCDVCVCGVHVCGVCVWCACVCGVCVVWCVAL